VVDTKKEHLAIDEAKKLGIPVIGILDTNCDPDEVQYPIPGNDDAIRSVTLLTRIVADAAAEGLIQRHQKPEDGAEAAEPLAAWEQELLQGTEEVQSSAETAKAADADLADAKADSAELIAEGEADAEAADVVAEVEADAAAVEATEDTEAPEATEDAESK